MKIFLDKIKGLFESPRDLDHTDLESFMVNIRLVIEHENLKEVYKILNLYCNWCMHAKIKDSLVAYRVLEHITNAIIKCNHDPDNSTWYSDAVIEGLKIHELQYEIEDFIFRFNLGITLFSERNFWKGFGKVLINNLMERPLELNLSTKNPKLLKIMDRINEVANEANQPNATVFSLEFIYFQSKQYFRVLSGTRSHPMEILGEMVIITFNDYVFKNQIQH
ncbi:hypothetical protein VRU48_08130 [Pedobacter sp. KR3-3]|uniref:Uncharacterized protein n=1 Tax=Pedobacter albus TaxID=3113905 RepID=A0ABU7I6Z7_9SPHI|nr:hypothetical protein [Pedobacter sp. KR3-3]MEE1945071.1 hypothetical protein [Pedobacter sp. KR3-3]